MGSSSATTTLSESCGSPSAFSSSASGPRQSWRSSRSATSPATSPSIQANSHAASPDPAKSLSEVWRIHSSCARDCQRWVRRSEEVAGDLLGVVAQLGGLGYNRGRQNLGQVVADRLLQLVVGAGVGVAVGPPADELGGVAEPAPLQMVVADLDHPLGPQRVNDSSLPGFQRLLVDPRQARPSASASPIQAPQSQGWPSKDVTSGWSSANSSRRRAIGKAPTTPAMASSPASVYSPSSSDPTRSMPRLWSR